MTFAESLGDVNEWHFFKEFVYSKNTFRPAPGVEAELADNVLWLGDMLFAFQLKERASVADTSAEAEEKWFKKKVLGKATRQVRDTLRYLKQSDSITLTNSRGAAQTLVFADVRQLHLLVVYMPNERLSPEWLNLKYHESETAGIIHLIPARDYLGMVRTLLTPAEVGDYLAFREALVARWREGVRNVPEAALLGQFLLGDVSAPPSSEHVEQVRSLDQRADEWDMSGVIGAFPDRMVPGNGPTDYYPIVQHLALLKREELREFKLRFQMAVEKSKVDQLTTPYRIAIPRLDCAFVFIPLSESAFPHFQRALLNFTTAHKYEMRMSKCIGVAIGHHDNGWFEAKWLYVEQPWRQDDHMDELLANDNPFRQVSAKASPRYAGKLPDVRS